MCILRSQTTGYLVPFFIFSFFVELKFHRKDDDIGRHVPYPLFNFKFYFQA